MGRDDQQFPVLRQLSGLDQPQDPARDDPGGRADPHERRQYNIAGVAPHDDGPLDQIELQRADVLLDVALGLFTVAFIVLSSLVSHWRVR